MISKKFATTSLCFAICAGTFSLSPALAQDTYVYQEQRLQSREVEAPAEEADMQEAEEAEATEAEEMTNPVVTEPAPGTVQQSSSSSTTTVESAAPGSVESSTSSTTVKTTAPVPGLVPSLSTGTNTTTTTETTVAAPAVVAPGTAVVTPVVPAQVVAAPVAVAPAAVAITLPTDRNYLLIDPISGEIKNGFDPTLTPAEMASLGGLVVVERSTGRLVAGIDSGRLIDVAVMRPGQTMIASIDQRRAELDRMITESIANGKLDASSATAMRSKLDAIAAQRARFLSSDNSLTFAEALTLAYGLNSMADHVVTVAHLPTLSPLPGTRFTLADGRISFMGDLDYRIFQLNRRIDSEYTLGRLSSRQVADLKQRLNDIGSEQDRNLQRGSLDKNKIQELVMKLDDVGSRLARSIAYRD